MFKAVRQEFLHWGLRDVRMIEKKSSLWHWNSKLPVILHSSKSQNPTRLLISNEVLPEFRAFRVAFRDLLRTVLSTPRSCSLPHTSIQGVYKRIVRFQKLIRNLFLTLHGHNVHRQQRQLSKFLTRHAWRVFSKPCTKLTLHCNHRSGHLKTEHTESLFLLRRHLGNWPRGPALSMRSELLVAHEKLGQLPLLTVYVLPL